MLLFCFFLTLNIYGQHSISEPFSEPLKQEFEFLSLCRCQEYLTLRNYDFIKWKSEASKQKQLQQDEYSQFLRYNTLRLSGQFYKEKYTGSTFLNKGISVYFGSTLDFKRLDSLYFEPMVQFYVENQKKSETMPYLGLGDVNFMMDCFYQVKEIPLEMELQLFLLANKQD